MPQLVNPIVLSNLPVVAEREKMCARVAGVGVGDNECKHALKDVDEFAVVSIWLHGYVCRGHSCEVVHKALQTHDAPSLHTSAHTQFLAQTSTLSSLWKCLCARSFGSAPCTLLVKPSALPTLMMWLEVANGV